MNNKMSAMITPATTEDMAVAAPEFKFTAVRPKEALIGKDWNNPPTKFPIPCPISSWFGENFSFVLLDTALPMATTSTKPIKAIIKAEGNNAIMSL